MPTVVSRRRSRVAADRAGAAVFVACLDKGFQGRGQPCRAGGEEHRSLPLLVRQKPDAGASGIELETPRVKLHHVLIELTRWGQKRC